MGAIVNIRLPFHALPSSVITKVLCLDIKPFSSSIPTYLITVFLLLPIAFGVDGIWFSVVAAEATAMIMDTIFVAALKKKYNY